MARKLSTFVHVHREDGQTEVFGPGDTVPDWAVKAISNPDVWVSGGGQAEPSPQSPPATTERPAGSPPPKGGPGSGAPAWREYAASKDVQVADDATREDVIAALTEAGVPTE